MVAPTGPEAIRPLVDQLTASSAKIKKAALEVYTAALWTTNTLPEAEQNRLWTNLRDALGFEPGTATAAGASPNSISR